MSEWQPIETAPKDRALLLYLDPIEVPEPCVPYVVGIWDVIGECWKDDAAEDGYTCLVTVTHWQPIPNPPSNQED